MRGLLGLGGRGGPMGFLSEMVPLILLVFLAAYLVLRWRDKDKEPDDRDPQLGFKSVLYAFQVFCLLILLEGAWRLLDYPLHFLTSSRLTWKALMQALFMIVASGGLFVGFEMVLSKTNTAEHWLPRKAFYGAALVIIGLSAIQATTTWLSGLLTARGPAWDQPLAKALIFVPATFIVIVLYQKLFSTAEGPTGPLAKGLLALGGSQFESMADSAAGSMAAAGAAMEAQAQPSGFPAQVAQPVAQQQVAASPMQAAMPQAGGGQDNCPTCGNPTRFIQQYNRTWCDTCQRYL